MLGSLIAVGQGASALIQALGQIRSESIKTNSDLLDKYFALAFNKDTTEDDRVVLLGALSKIDGHPLQDWAKERYNQKQKSIRDVNAAEAEYREAEKTKDTANKRVLMVEAEIEEQNSYLEAQAENPDARRSYQEKLRSLESDLALAKGSLADAAAAAGAADESVKFAKQSTAAQVSAGPAPTELADLLFVNRLTVDFVAGFFPNTPREIISKNLPYLVSALKEFHLTSPEMISYILATIRVETAKFEPISEIAPNSGSAEGSLYRGRGYVQLFGKENYMRVSQMLGLGSRLVDSPDDENDPEVAARTLCAFVSEHRAQIETALSDRDFVKARVPVTGSRQGDFLNNAFASTYSKVLDSLTSLPAVGFGIVFGADISPQSAMDEVKKAKTPPLSADPVFLYRRQGYWRSVAFFGTQSAANKQLPDFKGTWPGAYTVDISAWCPVPKLISAATADMVEQKDCQF